MAQHCQEACKGVEVNIKQIDKLFDRLDTWRHFPNYQLERRADIFFSLYLPEVLEQILGFAILPELIPEFPVRIGTFYTNIPIDKSYKIDYLALSAKADKAVLVELKTETLSRRSEQDKYLLAAQECGMTELLERIIKVFRSTNAKRKYFFLLEQLERIGLLNISKDLREIIAKPTLQGASQASYEIKITSNVKEVFIVYVHPKGIGPNVISFEEFAEVVRRNGDHLSQRFAASLCEWASIQAGTKY